MSSEQSEKPKGGSSAMKSLANAAGAAAKLVGVKAEQTKLTTLTLPAAYRALGKDCFQNKRHLDADESLVQQVQKVLAEGKALTEATKNQAAPQSFTDKAKAAGKQGADMARQKSLSMKRDSLLGDLGKTIFEQHHDNSGPEQLVKPIQEALARVAAIDEQIKTLSAVGSGSWITPKRLIIAVAVLMLLGAIGKWKEGSGSSGTKDNGSDDAEVASGSASPIEEATETTPRPSNQKSPSDSGRSTNKNSSNKPTSAPSSTLTLTAEQKQAISEIQRLGGRVVVTSKKGDALQVAVSLSTSTRAPDLTHLAPLSDLLTELDVSGRSITDYSFIESLTNIHILYLSASVGASLKPIGQLPHLESLSIPFNGRNWASASEMICSCRTIRHLRILDGSRNDIGGRDLRRSDRFDWIGNLKAKLQFLQIPFENKTFSAEEVGSIAECDNLETLVLLDGLWIVPGFAQLRKCSSLKTLSVTYAHNALIEEVRLLPKLTTFHSVKNSLSDTMWIKLDKEPIPNLKLLIGGSKGKGTGGPKTQGEWWYQYVPKTHELKPLENLSSTGATLQSRDTASSNQPADSLPALDMNERYDALISRIRLGMKRDQVEDILGIPDETIENDLGEFNPQKAGQILEICTWKGDSEDEGFIMLAFLNEKLQDGGTPGFDVGKGFKMKLPSNLDPQKKARLLNAMKTFGIRPIDN